MNRPGMYPDRRAALRAARPLVVVIAAWIIATAIILKACT